MKDNRSLPTGLAYVNIDTRSIIILALITDKDNMVIPKYFDVEI